MPDYKTYDFLYRNSSVATGGKLKLKNSNSIMLDVNYDSHAYYYMYTRETWDKEYDDSGKEISFPYFPGDKGCLLYTSPHAYLLKTSLCCYF